MSLFGGIAFWAGEAASSWWGGGSGCGVFEEGQ